MSGETARISRSRTPRSVARAAVPVVGLFEIVCYLRRVSTFDLVPFEHEYVFAIMKQGDRRARRSVPDPELARSFRRFEILAREYREKLLRLNSMACSDGHCRTSIPGGTAAHGIDDEQSRAARIGQGRVDVGSRQEFLCTESDCTASA